MTGWAIGRYFCGRAKVAFFIIILLPGGNLSNNQAGLSFKKMTNRLQQLLHLSESSPNDAFLLFAIAKEYEGMNEPQQALDWYLRLKNSQPGYVGLYYHLGKLYEITEQRDHALDAYATGIEVAAKAGDLHALSELKGAKMNLEIE
jgi:tetratricopeptide (TPR) repeat protein